jgi:hypothetical protein
MNTSKEPSVPPPDFDPATISQFSVIRVPFKFEGELTAISKLFVVIGHAGNCAICIKATSKTTLYDNNPHQMLGCVYFKAGEVPCFPENTVIQPDNQIAIEHSHIKDSHLRRQVKIHALPKDFPDRLRKAVSNSRTLTGRERKRIEALIS